MKSLICSILLTLGLVHAGAQTAVVPKDSATSKIFHKDSLPDVLPGDKTMTKVEIESEFPGGPHAWLQFLNDHLTYPNKAVRKKIEGTVLLQFIVDKEGNVSDLKALSGDPILQEAALKAMKDSPRWKPAIQNGRVVKSYKKQPIIFRLEPK
jgi:TonB family protein